MRIRYYIILLLTTLLSSCIFESDPPVETRTLPVVLSFAADVMGTPQQTRAIGDPGEGDRFELPQYVYLYVFGYSTEDKSGAPRMLQPTTGNPVRLSTNLSDWTVNANGNIYTYNHTIDILVGDANNFKSGEAYVVASVDQIDGITPTGADDAAKLANLKAKTFDFPSTCFTSTEMVGGTAVDEATAATNRNRFLKNLYSSPINLYYEWKNNSYTVENGEYKIVDPGAPYAQYYGTVLDASSKIPHVSMVLYHVAARLDVMWDVQNDLDMDKRVTGLEVQNLKSTGCRLFLPTNDGATLGGDYIETFLPFGSTNASLFWQGREVRYVIQPSSTDIPLSGTIQLRGDTPRPISATIQVTTPNRDIFTSWLRGYIKL